VSLANVERQLQPAMRYLNFSFKRASGAKMDTEGSRNVVVDGGERCLSCARAPRLGHWLKSTLPASRIHEQPQLERKRGMRLHRSEPAKVASAPIAPVRNPFP